MQAMLTLSSLDDDHASTLSPVSQTAVVPNLSDIGGRKPRQLTPLSDTKDLAPRRLAPVSAVSSSSVAAAPAKPLASPAPVQPKKRLLSLPLPLSLNTLENNPLWRGVDSSQQDHDDEHYSGSDDGDWDDSEELSTGVSSSDVDTTSLSGAADDYRRRR